MCVLILDAVIKLGKKAVVDKISVVIFLVTAVLAIFTDIPTVALIVLAGAAGYVIYARGGKKA